jgi:hypothetical protein
MAARMPGPVVTEVLVVVVEVVEKEVIGVLLLASDPPSGSFLALLVATRGASTEFMGVRAIGCARHRLATARFLVDFSCVSAMTQK